MRPAPRLLLAILLGTIGSPAAGAAPVASPTGGEPARIRGALLPAERLAGMGDHRAALPVTPTLDPGAAPPVAPTLEPGAAPPVAPTRVPAPASGPRPLASEGLPQQPSPPPVTSWRATGSLECLSGAPAQAQVAASRTHVVVTARRAIAFYEKSGRRLQTVTAAELFAPLGLAASGFDTYDGTRALFDEYRRRFWIASLAHDGDHACDAARRSKCTVAVSLTEDPLDGWRLYEFDAVAHDGVPSDPVYRPGDAASHPAIGIDTHYFYQANAVVDVSGGCDCPAHCPAYRYAHVVFYDADALASGTPPAGWQWWDLSNPDGAAADPIQPAVHHGAHPSTFFVSRDRAVPEGVVVWSLTGQLTPGQTMTRSAVQVSAFVTPVDAQQRGSSDLIGMTSAGTDMQKAVYRDGYVYAVANDDRNWYGDGNLTSVRLLRLNVSSYPSIPTTPASGLIDRAYGAAAPEDPPGSHVYYGWPAVDVNGLGDMVVAYARSASNLYPEARYSVYVADDTDISSSFLLRAGEAPYRESLSAPPATTEPWGEAAGAAVDPFDDTAVWVAQQYATPADSCGAFDNNLGIWVCKVYGARHADLVPQSLVAPASLFAGQLFEWSGAVHDQGDGAAAAHSLGLYLSTDADVTTTDRRIATVAGGPTDAGATSGCQAFTTLPFDVTPGNYTLGLIADTDGSLVEYSEANNATAGRAVTIAPGSGVLVDSTGAAIHLTLGAAPNPARDATRLRIVMPQSGRARLTVFDLFGRQVATPLDATLDPGIHVAAWDGRDHRGDRVPSGLYRLRLDALGQHVGATVVMTR